MNDLNPLPNFISISWCIAEKADSFPLAQKIKKFNPEDQLLFFPGRSWRQGLEDVARNIQCFFFFECSLFAGDNQEFPKNWLILPIHSGIFSTDTFISNYLC